MQHPRVMNLKDTKITIEIEAVRQSDHVIAAGIEQIEASGDETAVLFPYP